MLYFSPEFGKLIGASSTTRVTRRCTAGMAWQSSPDPKSGGYARATTLGHRPAPFPPDAGAQSTGTRGEDRADLARGRFVDRRFFRARKSTIARTQICGPSRAENLWRVSAPTRYPHDAHFACTTIAYNSGRSRCGSIELPWSASPRQRHSQVATSAMVCICGTKRAVTAHDGTT
jgi:hypothetical protein